MASSFAPQSPQLQKGALAIYDQNNEDQDPTILPFQYNPAEVRRTLAHRSPRQNAQGGGSRSASNVPEDIRRIGGPPVETITMTVQFSAVDALEAPDENELVTENGLHPVIAALEMLLYAPVYEISQNNERAAEGVIVINPTRLPLTLLVFGQARVVPIHLTSFSVTEEAFDTKLNPIRVKVELGMQVLTSLEVSESNKGKSSYETYLQRKQNLAGEHHQNQHVDRQTRGLLPTGGA